MGGRAQPSRAPALVSAQAAHVPLQTSARAGGEAWLLRTTLNILQPREVDRGKTKGSEGGALLAEDGSEGQQTQTSTHEPKRGGREKGLPCAVQGYI